MVFSVIKKDIPDGFRRRPVRTFNTAAIYFHKFRLVHSDAEYHSIVRLCDIEFTGPVWLTK